jgi:hypothetical protein
MTTRDQFLIKNGIHWLCRLAEELGLDPVKEIDDLDAWPWEPGEIALSFLEAATPNGTTQEAKIHIRCFPWEKSRIIRAAQGGKLEDFCRQALIEAAMNAD